MIITIKKDLTNVKTADKKKQILNILKKWVIEHREQKKEFRKEFLSKKNDKYFLELKELIGDFKELKKMSVLDFLAYIIICDDSEFKIIRELQKGFKKLKEDVIKEYNKKGGIK